VTESSAARVETTAPTSTMAEAAAKAARSALPRRRTDATRQRSIGAPHGSRQSPTDKKRASRARTRFARSAIHKKRGKVKLSPAVAPPPRQKRAGLAVSLEGSQFSRALLLRPLLDVPGRALARRVVDEAAERRLVDEVRRPLEERDHRHFVRKHLADLLDQREALVVVQLTVGLLEPLGDVAVAVLRVVGRIP